ncbi:fructose-1,6-bisphosphatase [Nitzschia inconspicua]|uniref:fructose-bisphosphatase n=1 Tax=Nitzschia inconspicua TaxID=303405 RepID=A0A9K3KIH8_9STRA|nr:fructose-1,6-bisphosphatase [Nitzschia inconspicua]
MMMILRFSQILPFALLWIFSFSLHVDSFGVSTKPILRINRVKCCWSAPTPTSSSSSSSAAEASTGSTAPSFDPKYYSPPDQSVLSRNGDNSASRITLTRFLSQYVKDHPEFEDLENILLAVQMACKTISSLVSRSGLAYSIQNDDTNTDNYNSDGRFYSMKRLDKLSTTVLKNALKFTGTVQMIVPEALETSEEPDQHQPGVLIAYDAHNLACLDPLDGSGNSDASICTGTVFGVFKRGNTVDFDEDSLLEAVLQPGNEMRAAGYCLYSSATVLVFTLGSSVYGFTLDPQIQEFVLTHDKLTIPKRGNVYSCNEANSEGWKDGWKEYLRNLKLGQGETKEKYALRYVGSMVGDIHRTLLYGGVFGYPSDRLHRPQGNLQLLYKSSPMAFVVHHAGGKAMDESGADLLDKRPERIHQKSPCFMGSPDDMEELKRYLTRLEGDNNNSNTQEQANTAAVNSRGPKPILGTHTSTYDGVTGKIRGVTLKLAIDMNGAVADVSATVSERFTCDASLDMVHRLRRDCDAVLVGRSTVEADDCTLTVRRVPTTNPQPTRVVLDSNLQLDLQQYKIATDGLPTIIVHAVKCNKDDDETKNQYYSMKIHDEFPNVSLLGIVPTRDGSRSTISARTMIDLLRSEFDIHHILVEGGPRTALQFLQEKMVDRAIVVQAPMTFKDGLPSNIDSITLQDAGLEEINNYKLDVDKVTCYSRPDLPWPSRLEDGNTSNKLESTVWP